VERGWPVRSVSRGRYPELDALGVEHQPGDLAEDGVAERAVSGCDLVFHVAAKTGVWGQRDDFVRANVAATEKLLAACRAAGVTRFVHTSSPSVIFDGKDHVDAQNDLPYPTRYLAWYPETKALAEQMVLAANDARMATVAIRPHLIWGPGDPWLLPRIFERNKSGRLRIVGEGINLVSITFVENAAAAHLQAAERLAIGAPWAGRPYFVNDEAPVALWPWLNDLFVRVGLPRVERRVPYGMARTAGALAEAAWSILGLGGEPPMTRFVAAQLATSHTYALGPARQAFGYQPVVEEEDALDRTVNWWMGRSR
jgi:nucleoside-diphosphate-sugar epimerase